ncbi:TRAF-like family protein [Euphorbia peplus]|nr:TRAF-like family protein [Euphorbia peplus]
MDMIERVKSVIHPPIQPLQHFDIIRELRDLPPLHFLFRINNFSHLYNAKIDNYQSTDFEVSGYKWRLSLYPSGNKNVDEKNHVSLYLRLSESNSLPLNREVNVYLKLFLYNHIRDKYLTVEDTKGRVRRFHRMKQEWGFDQLIPLNVFNDASNGYLINDSCVFGAEVFVLEGCCKFECASAVKELGDNSYTWKFENFAELEEETYFSDVFVIGGHRWKLEVAPDGFLVESGKSLSAYLSWDDSVTLGSEYSLYVEYLLRVRDQIHGKHHEQFEGQLFSSEDTGSGSWGFSRLIPLSKLYDTKHGYIVNGVVVIEVQISLITKVEKFC